MLVRASRTVCTTAPCKLQVYIPDDDMALTAASISLLFDFQSRFSLDLVQPMPCSPSSPCTPGSFMFQQPASALRHVGWVNVTVPTFSMEFLLDVVVPTLQQNQPGDRPGSQYPSFRLMPRQPLEDASPAPEALLLWKQVYCFYRALKLLSLPVV